MRIAIGQLWQETNTLNPLPTTRADFEQFGVLRGDEMVEQMAETNELGGFIESLRAWPEQPEIVGLVRLPAWPSGTATAETFAWLQDEMVTAVREALPVEALLLALHGAMTAEGHPDVEGEILAALRELVGPKLPIVATLDLHANVTEAMVRGADVLVTFHTAPHIDVIETGRRGARALRRILIEGARPVTAYQKIPAVVPAEKANTQAAAGMSREFKDRLIALEAAPGVLAAGLCTVQPWLDIPEFGTTVTIVTDDDAERAEEICRELSDEFWRRRREYLPELVPFEESVQQAAALGDVTTPAEKRLIVLGDGADATTSGAPGDSIWLLGELLKHRWPNGALVTLVAPEIVAIAKNAGQEASVEVDLGGRRDTRFARPIHVTATVERLFEAEFVLSGHLAHKLAIDMGPSAVLRVGDVRIVVTSRSGPHFAPELFRAAGLDPLAADVLVAKSPCGFRAAYEPHARLILHTTAPGCAPPDFWKYEYRNIPRPLWPWDEMGEWRAEPVIVSRK
ncbi:MAG: M81 family metallopeptidase [Pirellulales bacterium]|nr:M81 family metallopeptidase [Pirellulales bacterium]